MTASLEYAARAGWLMVGLGGCAPDFAYSRVLGPGRFELACPTGFPECAAMATNLCPTGYTVVGTKSGSTSSGATVQCNKPEPAPVVAPCPTATVAQEPEAPKKAVCSADYNCTEMGARCVSGTCVVVPVVASADEADRCVIGKTGSSEPVPMFPSEGALAQYVSSNPESRAAAFMTVTRLDGVWVDAGVRCHTLGQFERGRHVQLISGTFSGREGWLETDVAPSSAAPAASR